MRYFLLILIIPATMFCENKDYVVLHSRPNGMFSVMFDVLSMVDFYEKGYYSGVEVDFGKEGQYYEEKYGDNWFTYYWEPIKLGHGNVVHGIGGPPGVPGRIDLILSRKEIKHLIDKYIHLKPYVQDIVDKFYKDHFKGKYVISVHYRGTDKVTETPIVPYEVVFKEIYKLIHSKHLKNYTIFLATDEQAFLDEMVSIFGDKVCYQHATRSNDGESLHMWNHRGLDKYQVGLEAVVDCVLLSRGDFLLRTSSNLSLWSTFYNPDVPVYLLN